MTDPLWYKDAVCAQTDPECFFPEQGRSPRQALSVCAVCPVAQACLQEALADGREFGVWGGKTEAQRRAMRPRKQVVIRSGCKVEGCPQPHKGLGFCTVHYARYLRAQRRAS